MPEVCSKHPSTGRGSQSSLQSLSVHSVGLDIIGPFPKAVGNKRYLLVGIDYFNKWVEAKPLANIKDVDAKKFI